MFKNIHYDYRKSKIHLWEQINGENIYDVIDWVPYVFYDTNDGDYTSVFGTSANKKTFNSYSEYKSFIFKKEKQFYEAKIKPEIQFLVDRYYTTDYATIQIPILKVFYLDIETHNDEPGYSSVDEANDSIVLISILSSLSKKIITFGLKDFKSEYEGDIYIKCNSERELLYSFLNFMHKNAPDIISGWNIYNFDIPYIINRCIKILDDKESYTKLSPINQVSFWTNTSGNKNVDIAGVSIIDYLDIYKKFSREYLESYSLNFISNHELEKGKFDYSSVATDLKSLYKNNFDVYVEYNKTDVKRVKQIDDKKKFISLVQMLSLLTNCPMKSYQSQVALCEGALLTCLRQHNKCAPKMAGGKKESYEAAIVKEPYIGQYDWIIDADITSSYPTAIITLNMSVETYCGRIMELTEDEILNHVRNVSFPNIIKFKNKSGNIVEKNGTLINDLIKNKVVSIAPNGVLFQNAPRGITAELQQTLFNKRVELKQKMLAANITDQVQEPLKVLLNSMYGNFTVPYSRYFNLDIAEAITSCGRHALRMGEKFFNEILNNPNDELDAILSELK